MFVWVAPLFLICCWKWGDWKNWKEYYHTILYFILIDFLNNFLTANYPLWKYQHTPLNHTLSDVLVAFTVYPSTVLLFLPYYPKKIIRKVAYILCWVSLYTFIEVSSVKIGIFTYHNGWNIWWSIGFNFGMFIMLRFFYKHPLLAWPVSWLLITITLMFFKLPIDNMR